MAAHQAELRGLQSFLNQISNYDTSTRSHKFYRFWSAPAVILKKQTDEETARCQHSFVWEKEPAEGSPGRELDTAAYRLGVL
jgi:hypothetical protein